MALSDYMPYGAPELLDGAAPRMASSTLVASGFVAALVFAFGIIAANQPVTIEVPPDFVPPITFEPEPNRDGPQAAFKKFVISKPVSDPSDFKPVVDETKIEIPVDQPEPLAPGAPGKVGEPGVVRGRSGGEQAPPADPLPGVYVYTDELPQLVRGVKPDYPDLAREAGVEGTVKLQLLVGLDGHVLRAIVRPGGSVPMLDEAAIAAAMQCRFTPALASGQPVKVWVTQDYRFTLH